MIVPLQKFTVHMPKDDSERPSPEDIIRRAEREEREFTDEALRRHYQRESGRDDWRRLWIGLGWGLGIVAACGFAIWLVLR